jgi:branched-chain amino acid aminotransferase
MPDIQVWRVVEKANVIELEKVEVHSDANSLDKISQLLPGGSYTTFRTYYGSHVIRLTEHLTRLHSAARIIERNHFNLDIKAIRTALQDAIKFAPGSDHRIRLTLDLEQQPGRIYIALEELTPLPPSSYQKGVKTVTCGVHRLVPKAKLTNFIASASEIRGQLPEQVHEALMVFENKILEGLSSNFFAIKDGTVWTAEEGVLSGVTRSVVLDEIRQEGIPLHLWALPVADVPVIQEAFITSSSRGILPVVAIDDQQIGSGVPGPITMRLHQRYLQRIEDELEEI